MEQLKFEETVYLKDEVAYKKGGINRNTLIDNDAMKINLVAIDEGAELPKHSAPGDALFFCLEGQGAVVREDGDHPIHEGEQFVFKKGGEHAVKAISPLKFCLVVIKKK